MENLLKERNLPPFLNKDEMLDVILKEEYGYLPPKPDKVTWEVVEPGLRTWYSCFCAGKAYLEKVSITATMGDKEFSFPISVVRPCREGRFPFFIHINFRPDVPDRYMPTEELVDNGFAVLSFCYTDITLDKDEYSSGLAGVLYPDGKRGPHDAGKLSMWSWAIQRVMDYAQAQDFLDKDCATVCGHSRLGKTALLTAATDPRFRFAYSNDSGCCGAAITRGKLGENLAIICKAFPQWFCESFYKYAGDSSRIPDDLLTLTPEDFPSFVEWDYDMPFDQHYLVALAAENAYVLVGSADEDSWADPLSEQLSCVAAGKYMESLGKKGFVYNGKTAETGEAFLEGRIGYHLRKGCHSFSREDWGRLIQFIKQHPEA